MQQLPFFLGLGLCLTFVAVEPVRSAEQPVVDGQDAGDRSVTVERNGRTVSVAEDESGIRVTIVEGGETTVVEAENALALRTKSRRAHTLYQRYRRRGRSKADAEAAGQAVAGAAGGPGAGQVVGPGQLVGGNGLAAGNVLEAVQAMAAGNRVAWNRGFGATGTSASGSAGGSVSFRDGDRFVKVAENSQTGITVAITENGATKVVTARTADELSKKSPEAFRLYQKAGKKARVTAGAGGNAVAGANGNGNADAGSNAAGVAGAAGGGAAAGGGSASTKMRKRVLERMLRNARTEAERVRIRQLLRQLGR